MRKDLASLLVQGTLMSQPKKWRARLTRTKSSGQVRRVGRGLCFAGPAAPCTFASTQRVFDQRKFLWGVG